MEQVKAEADNIQEENLMSERWLAKAAAFELMSMGLLVPTPTLAEALSSGEYPEAFFEALYICDINGDGAWTDLACYKNAETDNLFHELRREHTRLFTKAPEPLIIPYVGVWADREQGNQGLLFVGKDSIEIEHFMRRCGVAKDLSLGQTNDPVDHIGTVCEFLKYLCLVNARAIKVADSADVRVDDYEEFHANHFAPYALWCSSQINALSSSPYYQFVADILEITAKSFKEA